MSSEQEESGEARGLSESKRKLLEQRLRGRSRKVQPEKTDLIPRVSEEAELFASPGQRWIYLAQSSAPHSAGFHISSSFEVSGELDCEVLEFAINEVGQRHSILR